MSSSSALSLPRPPMLLQSTFDPVVDTCDALTRVLHPGSSVEGRAKHAPLSSASKFAPGAYLIDPPAKRQRQDNNVARAKLIRRLQGEYDVKDKWEKQKVR